MFLILTQFLCFFNFQTGFILFCHKKATESRGSCPARLRQRVASVLRRRERSRTKDPSQKSLFLWENNIIGACREESRQAIYNKAV
jgi:hypothetical protein